jgi:hypothetical protein
MTLEVTDYQQIDESNDRFSDSNMYLTLYSTCMALLTISYDNSLKGMRESIKKAWSSIFQHATVPANMVEAMLEAVIGDEGSANQSGDGGSDSGEENEDEEGSDDDAMDVDKGGDSDEEGQDEEDEEEVMIDKDKMMKLLGNVKGDSDDEGSMDGSDDGVDADAALANMIQLRKQGRKHAQMQGKRDEYIARSRALDMVEVLYLSSYFCLLLADLSCSYIFIAMKIPMSCYRCFSPFLNVYLSVANPHCFMIFLKGLHLKPALDVSWRVK